MDLCFTVVIKGNNGYQFSYQLAYQPCPIWTEENRDRWIINMCDDGLFYKKGAFKKLLDKTGIYHEIHPDRQCVLIADKKSSETGGYDSPDVVKRIVEDIESEGFKVTVVEF